MTLLQLRAAVRKALQEPNTDRFSDSDLTDWLNDGQADVNNRIEFLVQRSTADLVIGEKEVAVPGDFLRFRRFTFDSNPLYITTADALDAEYGDGSWASETGTPTHYYFLSPTTAVIWPTPDAAKTVQLTYSRTPVTMSLDADVPEIPEEWHRLLVLYAVSEARKADRSELWQAAWQEYEAKTEAAKAEVRRRQPAPILRWRSA